MTIQEAVSELLKSKPYLEEFLADGLINTSALARQLTSEISRMTDKKANKGAVVMAIQRHHPGKLTTVNIKAGNLLKGLTNIIVRSDISVFTYTNSTTLPGRLAELSTLFSKTKGLFYTFSQGAFETTIIINQTAEPELEKVLLKENQIATTGDLACITLYLPDENIEIAGYYYYILKLIAWEGINIIEILSTTNEFTLILAEEDVDKAFSILKNARNKRQV
jgi:aspartokinase